MKTMMTLAIATMIIASVATADESRAPRILVDKPGLVTTLDNDGGRVELYARSHAARTVEFHGGAVVQQPLVELLFVGTWDKSRADLLRQSADHIGATDEFQSTHERGVKATALPITTRTLAGRDTMNDLDVQSMIDRAIEHGSLPSRNDDTIYVLFLSPAISSTLGDKTAGTDYASYHSHFHSHDVNVRYVVVPFHNDVNVMNQAAAASLIRAIVNPDGDGWY
ncbi:MAG TPA: hypothetical protein VGR95_02035 [Thermoanaerobaculia bacterium]|nr:hypothetical protein [Thermoanaerobaculia bacterium]